jgi:hypothetical protein
VVVVNYRYLGTELMLALEGLDRTSGGMCRLYLFIYCCLRARELRPSAHGRILRSAVFDQGRGAMAAIGADADDGLGTLSHRHELFGRRAQIADSSDAWGGKSLFGDSME